MKLDAAAILAICPLLGLRANDWVDPLNQVIISAELNTPVRLSYFMAEARHESNQFTELRENMNYGGEALLRVFPKYFNESTVSHYIRSPREIANRVYANRMGNGDSNSGDGWKFRAGGIFGITGQDNYRIASIALFGDSTALVDDPDLIVQPNIAAMAAAWYWRDNDLNAYADRGDFDGASDLINIGHKTAREGDSIGFADRRAGLDIAMEVFA